MHKKENKKIMHTLVKFNLKAKVAVGVKLIFNDIAMFCCYLTKCLYSAVF